MKFYPENYSVEVIVTFTDLNGAAVTPTAVRAVLFDGEGDQVSDLGDIEFQPGDTQATIVVPATLNYLDDGETRALRVLRIELETAAGIIPRSHSYAIESEQRLVPLTNTFLTLEAAELEILDTVKPVGWSAASEDDRRAALVEAFRRITSIPMKFQTFANGIRSSYDVIAAREVDEETIITREAWETIDPATFAKFPLQFRKALRRAQIVEANELLQGDPVGEKHRAGIVTETIGESSVTLRGGRVDYGIGSQTLKALSGYIYFNLRIARA